MTQEEKAGQGNTNQERRAGPNERRSGTKIGGLLQNFYFFVSNVLNLSLERRFPRIQL